MMTYRDELLHGRGASRTKNNPQKPKAGEIETGRLHPAYYSCYAGRFQIVFATLANGAMGGMSALAASVIILGLR